MTSGLFGLIGVVIGGLITYLVASYGDRRRRLLVERDHRLAAAQEVLGSLQELNRRIIDVARVDSTDHNDRDWHELHLATIRWNTARYGAALITPEAQIGLLQEIDTELDSMMDAALSKQWVSRDFRGEREQLGRLGASYMNRVRVDEGLEATGITSLWPWGDKAE